MSIGSPGKWVLINDSSLTPSLASLPELFPWHFSVYFTRAPDRMQSVFLTVKQTCLTQAIIYKVGRESGSCDKTSWASAILSQAKVSPREQMYHSSRLMHTCASFQTSIQVGLFFQQSLVKGVIFLKDLGLAPDESLYRPYSILHLSNVWVAFSTQPCAVPLRSDKADLNCEFILGRGEIRVFSFIVWHTDVQVRVLLSPC